MSSQLCFELHHFHVLGMRHMMCMCIPNTWYMHKDVSHSQHRHGTNHRPSSCQTPRCDSADSQFTRYKHRPEPIINPLSVYSCAHSAGTQFTRYKHRHGTTLSVYPWVYSAGPQFTRYKHRHGTTLSVYPWVYSAGPQVSVTTPHHTTHHWLHQRCHRSVMFVQSEMQQSN